MAWAQVGTGTAVAIPAGAGNQSVSLPGTPKVGDHVVVAVAGDISCANSVATSGYTAVENGTGANPGAYLAYKVLTTAETTVDIVRDGTILKSCVVQVWSGVDPAAPKAKRKVRSGARSTTHSIGATLRSVRCYALFDRRVSPHDAQ